MTIAITGATGHIGGGVFQALLGRTPLRIIGRNAPALRQLADGHTDVSVAEAEYADTAAMTAGLAGVQTLFFVSGRETEHRRAEHESVVAAAHDAGVARIVYLSFAGAAPEATFTFAQIHWHTEQAIRATGLAFTFLRDNWYQSALPMMVDPTGVIRGPGGTGVMAAVAPDDVIRMAATVVGDAIDAGAGASPHDGRTYELTGPEAFSFADAAATLSRASGRTIRYEEETLEEAYLSREVYRAPKWEVDGWVTSYAAVATGELSHISADIAEVTGVMPMTLEQFLAAHPEVVSGLRG